MSIFDELVESLQGLPTHVSESLIQLKERDKSSHLALQSLAKEETELFEQLKTGSKQDSDFDEVALKEKANLCVSKRSALLLDLENQVKLAHSIYEELDGKIAHLDSSTRDFTHLLGSTNDSEHLGENSKKKKKRKANTEDSTAVGADLDGIAGAHTDPNEPVYCICRRISFGPMIGCENPDCSIEWFHFPCVGITAQPQEGDLWYCPNCK